MRIQVVVCSLLLLLLVGCQAGKSNRIVGSTEFISESRPPLTVSLDEGFFFVKEEQGKGSAGNVYGYSSDVKEEAYVYVKTVDENKIQSGLSISISTLRGSRGRWNQYQFDDKNALFVDNNGGALVPGYRSMIYVIKKTQGALVEYLESRGYKMPLFMIQTTLIKNQEGSMKEMVSINFFEALGRPKYDSIDWNKALAGEGPDRDKALKVFRQSFQEQVKINQ